MIRNSLLVCFFLLCPLFQSQVLFPLTMSLYFVSVSPPWCHQSSLSHITAPLFLWPNLSPWPQASPPPALFMRRVSLAKAYLSLDHSLIRSSEAPGCPGWRPWLAFQSWKGPSNVLPLPPHLKPAASHPWLPNQHCSPPRRHSLGLLTDPFPSTGQEIYSLSFYDAM